MSGRLPFVTKYVSANIILDCNSRKKSVLREILKSLSVRSDVTVNLWNKMYHHATLSTICSLIFLNAVFLRQGSVVNANTLQCSSESGSGLCQCSFSTAPVWMMRFSSLRSLAWKVHRSAAWHPSEKDELAPPFLQLLSGKKKKRKKEKLLASNKALNS